MTHDHRGPIAVLDALGVPQPIWANRERHAQGTRREVWDYHTQYLTTSQIIPISHLIATGEWQAFIDPIDNEIRIRLQRTREEQR